MEPRWLVNGMSWSVSLGYPIPAPLEKEVPPVMDSAYWEYFDACERQIEERF